MKLMFCSKCGSSLDENGNCLNPSCSNHKAVGQEHATKFPLVNKHLTFAEKGKRIIPDCVTPDLDETPIRQYDIARLQTVYKGAFAEGRLQVTNKRVLFRSAGTSIFGSTFLQHEFSIEEIAGIEIRKEARLNIVSSLLLVLFAAMVCGILQPVFGAVYSSKTLATIFPVLVAGASILLFVILRKKWLYRYMALTVLYAASPLNSLNLIQQILGTSSTIANYSAAVTLVAFLASLFCLAFAPNLVIKVLTKGGSPSAEIRRKDGLFFSKHNEYTGFSQVMPGPDADLAMKELGAVIREVQQTGTYTEK